MLRSNLSTEVRYRFMPTPSVASSTTSAPVWKSRPRPPFTMTRTSGSRQLGQACAIHHASCCSSRCGGRPGEQNPADVPPSSDPQRSRTSLDLSPSRVVGDRCLYPATSSRRRTFLISFAAVPAPAVRRPAPCTPRATAGELLEAPTPRRGPGRPPYPRHRHLAEPRIGNARDTGVGYAGMTPQHLLDLLRHDLQPAAVDHVAQTRPLIHRKPPRRPCPGHPAQEPIDHDPPFAEPLRRPRCRRRAESDRLADLSGR